MKRIVAVIALLAVMTPLTPARGQAEFPENLKGVIPEYPGATVTLGITTGEGAMVHLEVDDDPVAVIDFYKKAMTKKGWSVDAETNLAKGGMLLFKKGNQSLSVMVMAPEGEEKTRMVLSLSSE